MLGRKEMRKVKTDFVPRDGIVRCDIVIGR